MAISGGIRVSQTHLVIFYQAPHSRVLEPCVVLLSCKLVMVYYFHLYLCIGRHYDSDHKRWKANFRCALNSLPDVKENKEQGIKKGNNAFKVYRFLDAKETRGLKEAKAKKKQGIFSFLYGVSIFQY